MSALAGVEVSQLWAGVLGLAALALTTLGPKVVTWAAHWLDRHDPESTIPETSVPETPVPADAEAGPAG